MGLSIRHPKGKLSRRWYWDCQINDRSVSVGLCKMQGRPPREWSLAVPDWSVAHAGDRAFEESRARAVEMAPAAIARKRELLNKTPRAIMEQALKQAQGSKRRKIPTIRTLHADYAEDTERLREKKLAAGQSVGELDLKRRNLKRFCDWWLEHRRGLANKSILEVSRSDAEEFVEYLRAPEGESQLRRKVVTVEKMRKHLKCVFDRMLPEGSANPFLLDPIPKDEEEDTHPAVVDERELGLVAETAREKDLLIHDLAMLSINTSLRKGDCCTLEWDDVHLDAKCEDRTGNVFAGYIRRTNRKTKRTASYPITEMLRQILERRFSERRPGDRYVFEEAAELYERNPDGLTYRLQKVFVDALGPERGIFVEDAKAPKLTPLSEVLEDAKAKARAVPMSDGKRRKVLRMLDLYAEGKTYAEVSADVGCPKSLVSLYLNEIQDLMLPVYFIKPKNNARPGYRKAIKALTRDENPTGMKRTSKLNFMTFRTSFVTILCRKGVKADLIKRFTAHTSTRMIEAIYDQTTALDYAGDVIKELPANVTMDQHLVPYPQESAVVPARPAVALPPPSSGEMTLAEIVKQLSKEDKAKLKALPPEEKADILKLRTLDDFETFLALR